MPWLKTSAFHKDLASGVLHRFLLPNGLLLFSAFFQMFTYGIATTGNQTSAASVQLTLQPTPSSKSPSRSTRPVSETTTLRIVKDVSSSPRDFKASVSIILSKQTTWIVQPSRGNISSTGVMGNNESSVILYDEGIVDEDKSVVFYRKIGGWITLGVVVTALVFLTVTHFSSIHYVNKGEQIKESFCSISSKPEFV